MALSGRAEFYRLGSSGLSHCRETDGDVFILKNFARTGYISGAAPYTFLGQADYVKHEGSKPMNIIWKLHRPIPAKYLNKTNKLVVG